MKKTILLFNIFILYFFLVVNGFAAKNNYFDEGRKLFDKKESRRTPNRIKKNEKNNAFHVTKNCE